MAQEEDSGRDVVIEHPNRDKASSKTTKWIVVVLLLASAALMGIVALGAWKYLVGARIVLVAYALVYVLLAFYCARWTRGTLPMAAALGIIMAIFAFIAGPQWFVRSQAGYASPTIPSDLVGIITLALVPVEFLLITFAMQGFRQEWQVEVERKVDDRDREAEGEPEPAPA